MGNMENATAFRGGDEPISAARQARTKLSLYDTNPCCNGRHFHLPVAGRSDAVAAGWGALRARLYFS